VAGKIKRTRSAGMVAKAGLSDCPERGVSDRKSGMKLKAWHLVPAVIIGVVAGRMTAPSPAGPDAANAAGENTRSTRSSVREMEGSRAHAASSRAAKVREEIRKVSPGKVPALLENIMRSSDPADRMGLLIEAFEAVDGSNVGEVFSAFDRMRHESGQTHHSEYMMAAYVAGKQTGGAVMDSWLEKGFKENITAAHESFFGWSSQNPQEAERWLEKIAEQYPAEKSRLMQALIGGMAVGNPQEAMVRLDSMSEPERSKCVTDLGFHLTQGEGVDSAIDWMLRKKAEANSENQAYVDAITREVSGRLIWSATGGRGLEETVRRLEKINAASPVDPAMMGGLLYRMPGSESLDLMEKLSSGSMPQSEQQIATLTANLYKRGPHHVNEWLKNNPDSPLHDSVAAAHSRMVEQDERIKAEKATRGENQ
jgi:hypothetical protein